MLILLSVLAQLFIPPFPSPSPIKSINCKLRLVGDGDGILCFERLIKNLTRSRWKIRINNHPSEDMNRSLWPDDQEINNEMPPSDHPYLIHIIFNFPSLTTSEKLRFPQLICLLCWFPEYYHLNGIYWNYIIQYWYWYKNLQRFL